MIDYILSLMFVYPLWFAIGCTIGAVIALTRVVRDLR